MTFSEYKASAEFAELALRKRRAEKKWKYDLFQLIPLVFALLAAFLMENVLKDALKERRPLYIGLLCGTLAVWAIAMTMCAVLNFRTRGTENNKYLLLGFLLYMRERRVDFSAFMQGGVLCAELNFPAEVNAQKVDRLLLGSGEHAAELDFSPWGGLDALAAYTCVGVGLMDFLSAREFPAFETVTVQWGISGNAFALKTPLRKPYCLVKKGKWTTEGRFMRRYYRYALKKAEKAETGHTLAAV